MGTTVRNEGNIETTTPPFALGAGVLQDIPLAKLRESAWNPRQYYPEAAMTELTESMRQDGFRPWLPIVVRPLDDDLYEIAAGHRRSRAAAAAGIGTVPCLVRSMNDGDFLDVLNFDNCGREDVHPLHEASGWHAWMEKTGNGVADIAAKIGQSKEYVYQRLKYKDLIESGRAAFLEGKITAGHAILIARLQPRDQEKALKHCEPPKWDPSRRISVRDLAQRIQHEIHLVMDDAPFDLADETLLPGAGPCTVCMKRTKNAPELVQITYDACDVDEAEDLKRELADTDECTDPSCFTAKRTAHLDRVRADVLAKSGNYALEISSSYKKPKKGVLGRNEYTVVSAKDGKGAKTAIIVDGSKAGKVVQVKLTPKTDNSTNSYQALQWRREAEEKKRKEKVGRELPIRVKILSAISQKVSGLSRADLEGLLRAVLEALDRLPETGVLCQLHGIAISEQQKWAGSGLLLQAIPKMSETDLFRLAVELSVLDDFDEYQVQESPAGLIALAKRYKVDAAKIRSEMESAQKEAEGGTRREVEKPHQTADPSRKQATKKKPAKKASRKKAKPSARKALKS